MRSLRGPIRNATSYLTGVSRELIESADEWVIWRHQRVGERNPLAHNAMGEDPHGLFWVSEDHVIRARSQGMDDQGLMIYYCRVEPVRGDLFVALATRARTPDEAVRAPRTAYYTVEDFDVRRDAAGRIIYTRVHCRPDRSGRWNDYAFNPQLLP